MTAGNPSRFAVGRLYGRLLCRASTALKPPIVLCDRFADHVGRIEKFPLWHSSYQALLVGEIYLNVPPPTHEIAQPLNDENFIELFPTHAFRHGLLSVLKR